MDQATKLRSEIERKKFGSRPIKVISVTSGKGGVGKTQVTANLALALRARGREVLIFDGDMGLANIDIIYNISPPYNLQHLLTGQKTIQEVIFSGPDGVKILPASSGVQELTQMSADNKRSLMDQLEQIDGLFDYLIIDTAAGISDNVMYLNSAAQFIFVVVTPEPTSITDAYALMKVLSQKYGEKTFHIITNQCASEAEANNIFKSLVNATDQFLEGVQLWHMHSFMTDPKVRQSITRQKPVIKFDEGSEIAKSFHAFAKKVEGLEVEQKKAGMQFFVQQALGRK
jgi:flagellar biosynthesis protein FlhG